MARKKRAKKPKQKLSAEDAKKLKLKTDHIRSVRNTFRNLGFDRLPQLTEKEIVFEGQKSDIDDAFLHENVLVLVEYTMAKGSNVTDHIKNKAIILSKIINNIKGFVEYLRGSFPAFDEKIGKKFHEDKYILRLLYCSRHDYDEGIKANVSQLVYLDYPILKYFERIASAIKFSARPDLLEFMRIDVQDVAVKGVFPKPSSEKYDGSILPESASGFPSGFKVVSFYSDAASLLQRAYVLRRDGWRGSYQAYQRMIQPGKIEAIRRKLRTDRQVFVNNLIATLPSDVQPINSTGKTVDITKLTKTAPVSISLPLKANSVGLIDGQHRLFSYYESRDDDPQIATLRHEQNLLVTGIIYPDGTDKGAAELFEARMFLAINANQTNAPAALRQEIEVFLSPFSQTAIARAVMQRLSKKGPLAGHVETHFFDKGKLKTTSIVSYGLGPLIKLSGTDSLFFLFESESKEKLADASSVEGLEDYLKFAVASINIFLAAVKANVDADRWTEDTDVKNRLLTVTYVNSFLITLRMLIAAGQKIDFSSLKTKLTGIGGFNFKSFHSSQYGRMAEKIFKDHFTAK